MYESEGDISGCVMTHGKAFISHFLVLFTVQLYVHACVAKLPCIMCETKKHDHVMYMYNYVHLYVLNCTCDVYMYSLQYV